MVPIILRIVPEGPVNVLYPVLRISGYSQGYISWGELSAASRGFWIDTRDEEELVLGEVGAAEDGEEGSFDARGV